MHVCTIFNVQFVDNIKGNDKTDSDVGTSKAICYEVAESRQICHTASCAGDMLAAGLHAEADETWRAVHQASMNALRRLSCAARLGTAEEYAAAASQLGTSDAAGALCTAQMSACHAGWSPCLNQALLHACALGLNSTESWCPQLRASLHSQSSDDNPAAWEALYRMLLHACSFGLPRASAGLSGKPALPILQCKDVRSGSLIRSPTNLRISLHTKPFGSCCWQVRLRKPAGFSGSV